MFINIVLHDVLLLLFLICWGWPPGANTPVADSRPAEGLLLRGQRGHSDQRPALGPHDRPPGPGLQVDQEHGEEEQAGGHQVLGHQLPKEYSERCSGGAALPTGECGRESRSR